MLPPTLETQYAKLQPTIRDEIDKTFNFFIKPTEDILTEMASYHPTEDTTRRAGSQPNTSSRSTIEGGEGISGLIALNESLQQISISAIRLDSEQKRLQVWTKTGEDRGGWFTFDF
jgi:hypothetical protein